MGYNSYQHSTAISKLTSLFVLLVFSAQANEDSLWDIFSSQGQHFFNHAKRELVPFPSHFLTPKMITELFSFLFFPTAENCEENL